MLLPAALQYWPAAVAGQLANDAVRVRFHAACITRQNGGLSGKLRRRQALRARGLNLSESRGRAVARVARSPSAAAGRASVREVFVVAGSCAGTPSTMIATGKLVDHEAGPELMEWPAPPSGVVGSPANQEEEGMNISVLGIDLGKNVCSVVGLDASGAAVMHGAG